jgi:sterol desaturase/sphingolipid hydroxylase (fatty acid hydroxylase superfamily)
MLSTSAFPSVTEQQLSRTVVIGRTINPRVRTVLRRILPYLFVGVFPALGVTAVGSGSWLGLLAIYAAVEVTAMLAERFIPFIPAPHLGRWRQRRTDILYLVSSALVLLAMQETVLPALHTARTFLLGNQELWVSFLPVPVQVALALVAIELAYYGAHRLSHGNNIFWRSHRIHHSPEGLDRLMGWRIHWLNEVLHTLARIVPFVVLGVPPHVIAIVTVIVKVHSMFPHINTDVDSGPVLPRLIVTPETHRWHHLVDINRVGNYAATTVVWDHVFRTYRSPGLTPDTLFGIPASDGERVPEGWLQQLLAPWRNPKAVDAAASLS